MSNPRATFAALLALLRRQPDPMYPLELLQELSPQAVGDLVTQLGFHGLSGWAHRLLRSAGVSLGDAAMSRLKLDWRANQARSIILQEGYRALSTVLGRAGIEHAPLKGLALLRWLYEEPGAREVTDVDVLVRESDVDACHRALLAARYSADSSFEYERCLRYMHHAHYRCSSGVRYEIHWRLSVPQSVAPDLWEGAIPGTPGEFGSGDVQLAHGPTLYSLLTHIASHLNGVRLKWLLDVRLLLEKTPECWNAEKLVAVASRAGTLSACYFGLCMTSQFTNSPVANALGSRIAVLLPAHRRLLIHYLASPRWAFRTPASWRSKWPTYGCSAWLPDTLVLRYRKASTSAAFKLHLEGLIP